MPELLFLQSSYLHNMYLYVIGGTSGFEYDCDVHRLDLNTLKWEVLCLSNEVKSMPPPARYFKTSILSCRFKGNVQNFYQFSFLSFPDVLFLFFSSIRKKRQKFVFLED